jgi:hypothetical protein
VRVVVVDPRLALEFDESDRLARGEPVSRGHHDDVALGAQLFQVVAVGRAVGHRRVAVAADRLGDVELEVGLA